jgi:hypothetical protein
VGKDFFLPPAVTNYSGVRCGEVGLSKPPAQRIMAAPEFMIYLGEQ